MIELESIAHLPKPETYWYIATPYTKYADGLNEAYSLANRISISMTNMDINNYTPIAWSHRIGARTGIDLVDHEFWMAADMPFMQRASGLLIVQLPGWDQSRGVKEERRFFESIRKPVYGIDPGQLIKLCECKDDPRTGLKPCDCGSQSAARGYAQKPPSDSPSVEWLLDGTGRCTNRPAAANTRSRYDGVA